MTHAEMPASAGGSVPQPPFHPVMAAAALQVEAIRAVTGEATARAFTYFDEYLDHGFPGQGNDAGKNVRELFLQLQPPAGSTPLQPIVANFKKQSDRTGGFLAPNLSIQGLSRAVGPVN